MMTRFGRARGRDAPQAEHSPPRGPVEEHLPRALFLLSAGVLTYELLLMRIFAVLMQYHFASLAIGLALLGLGAGGVTVGLSSRARGDTAQWIGSAGFGIGALGLLAFLGSVHADPHLARMTLGPFHQPSHQPFAQASADPSGWWLALRLAAVAVCSGLPFLGAGVATAAMLREATPSLHTPYAASFLGSAAACLVTPLCLLFWSASALLAVAAVLGCAAALVVARAPKVRWTMGGIALLALAVGVWAERTGGAELPFARGQHEPQLLSVRWNPMSRVAAFPLSTAELRRPFGLSRAYRGPIPDQIGLVVDDHGYTNLYSGVDAAANLDYFRANLVSLPYHLRPSSRALIIGPGGGKDIWIALSSGGASVHAVEINPQVIEMAQDVFGDFTGRLYDDSRVTLTLSEARRFATLDTAQYDVIEAAAVIDRPPPSAGAFTLSEDLLHTLEAFEAYWNRLAPAGILSVTQFAYGQRALRLAALARAHLERAGVASPGNHVRVVSDRGLVNFLISRRPFTPEDDRILGEKIGGLGFNPLYPPTTGATTLSRILESPDLADTLAGLPHDLSPPTDDRPFFYYTLRFWDLLHTDAGNPGGQQNRGPQVLLTCFLLLAGLTLALIFVPLTLVRGLPGRRRQAVFPLLYAAALGFGYMALEIGTLQRLSLFLGHPLHAAAATLFAFLLGSGAGSLWSSRIVGSRGALAIALVAAAGFGIFQALVVPDLLGPCLGLPGLLRWVLAAGLILPLAFALGICFPAGLALLGRSGRQILPWAWAVNGASSVLGSLGALVLAMNLGYTATLAAGSALYLAALVSLAGFPVQGQAYSRGPEDSGLTGRSVST